MNCVFKNIVDVLHEVGVTEYVDVVNECKNIYESPEIKIGLWGDFSSGKSSFLNAMLGQEVFPVNITEMTAMATELRYGDELELVAVKEDKEYPYPYTKELANILLTRVFRFEDLKASARKKLDPSVFEESVNKLKEDGIYSESTEFDNFLDKVIVKCNFEMLKSGIVFVDLPGLKGSSSHSALTAHEIKNCSMVIYFKSSDRPLSKYDKEVLDDLKDANEKMVLFGIYNKCDLELKSYFKELGDRDFVINTRKEILGTFINEVENFAKLDEYFAISPLMMHYYNMKNESESEALSALKEDHPSKFRFLKEDHPYDLIAGISDFNARFFDTIDRLREEAKSRVIEGKFVRVIKEIDDSISKREQAIQSNANLSLEEYEDAKNNLALQEKKLLQLKSFGPKVQGAIKTELAKFVNQSMLLVADEALLSLSKQSYHSQNDFNDDLARYMSKSLSSYISNEGSTGFQNVVEKGLSTIKNDIGVILEDISEVTGLVLKPDLSSDLDKSVDSRKLNLVNVDVGLNFETKLTGGAIALDVGLILADVGSLGLFTLGRLAFAGFKSMDEGKGFLEGVFDVFENLFESREDKERRALNEFLSSLSVQSERKQVAQNIVSKMEGPYASALRDIVVNILKDNNKINEEIDAIGPKIEEAYRIIEETLENKQKSDDEKRVELSKTRQGRESLKQSLDIFYEKLSRVAA
jgi:GTPase SAR1 family protein